MQRINFLHRHPILTLVLLLVLSYGTSSNAQSCSSTVSDVHTFYDFNNVLDGWTHDNTDDFDWRLRSGRTPSNNTGPSGAIEGSHYIYVEASNPNYPSKVTILNSPCYDLPAGTNATATFRYHMYGSRVNQLELQYTTDDITWSNLWSRNGDQGNSWESASVDLSPYTGSSFKLRFRGETGTETDAWRGDMAVDALNIDYTYSDVCANSVISNGGFESGSSNWTLTGNAFVTSNASDVYTGSGAIELDNPGDLVYQTINASSGQEFFLSYYAKSASSNNLLGVNLSFYNAGGALLQQFTSNLDVDNIYKPYGLKVTAPANTSTMRVEIFRDPASNNDLFVDDLCVKKFNNAPVATDNEASVSFSNQTHTSNLMTSNEGNGIDSDVDGDPLVVTSISASFVSGQTVSGTYGTLQWFSNGNYTYNLNVSDPDYIALSCGSSGTESFTYSISDGQGGTNSASLIIDVNPYEPIAGTLSNNTICSEESVTFSTSNQGFGVSYSWDFGSNASPSTASGIGPHDITFTNYTAGNSPQNNIVTLTATRGTCTDNETAVVTVNKIANLDLIGDSPLCLGNSLTIDESNGEADTYAWTGPNGFSSNAEDITIANPTAANSGLYNLTATHVSGCVTTQSKYISIIENQEVLIAGDDQICPGESTTLTASGAESYQWSTGATTASITVMPGSTTTYSVTGFNKQYSNLVRDLSTYDDANFEYINSSGSYGNSASLFNGIDDTSAASFHASRIQAGEDWGISYTLGGTYGLNAIGLDRRNDCCDERINGAVIQILDEGNIVYTSNAVAGSGSAIEYADPAPNVDGDEVRIIFPNGINTANGAVLNFSEFIISGETTCSADASYEVVMNTVPSATIAANGNNDVAQVNICEATSSTLVATGSSGTGPYTYAWSTGASTSNITVSPSSSTTYTVTVMDAIGCTSPKDIDVIIEPNLVPTITDAEAICEDDVTIITAGGGDDYVWSTGATGASITIQPSVTTNYEVTISNSYGCEETANVTITVSPEMSTIIDYNGAVCLDSDTELVAVTSGGTAPFEYQWIGPTGLAGTTEIIPIDTNGNYYVTVTDVYGCASYSSGIVYERYSPTVLNLQTEICEGDPVTMAISSNSTNSYLWSTNANDATTPSVVVYPSPPSESYQVTVTNGQGCTAVANSTIVVDAKTPVTFEAGPTLCMGDTTSVNPKTGGTWSSTNANVAVVSDAGLVTGTGPGTAELIFSDGSTGCSSDPLMITVYTNPSVLAVNDFEICDGEVANLSATATGNEPISLVWDNGAGTGTNVSVSPVGNNNFNTDITYNVTATDVNGCTDDDAIDITVFSNPAPTISKQNANCGSGVGSITFTFPNHPERNTIKLSVDDGVNYIELNDNFGSFTFTNLPVGNYPLKARWGDNECEIELGTTNISADPLASATIDADSGACGSIGQGSITFTFPNTIGRTNIDMSINGGASYDYGSPDNAGTFVINGVLPGTYDIWMRWGNDDCPNFIETVVVHDASFPTAVTTPDSTICEGDIIELHATGGDTYLWNNGNNTDIISISPAVDSTYSVTVTSLAGCSVSRDIDIEVSPAQTLDIDYNGSVCLTATSQLTADHTGGTAPFTYAWTGPSGDAGNTPTITVTVNGNYFVTVTDSKGCEISATGFVYESFDAFILDVNTDICEGESVTLIAAASSGTNFSWSANTGNSTNSSVEVFPTAPSSTYKVTVTNNVGCVAEATSVLAANESPTIALTGADNLCIGATANLTSSSAGIWLSSDTDVADVNSSGVVSALSAGSTIISFVDGSTGCESNGTIEITVNAPPNVQFVADNIVCIGDTSQLSPGMGGTWTSTNITVAPVSNDGRIEALSPGSAKFVFVDATTGCSNTTDLSLIVNSDPTIVVPTSNPICIGTELSATPSTGGYWESSDDAITTIDDNGLITAISEGKASFIFTNLATGCQSAPSDSLEVLTPLVVYVDGDTLLCLGDITTLYPSTGGTWESENSQIASVTNTGEVTAVQPGVVRFRFTDAATGCVSDFTNPVTINGDPFLQNQGSNSICVGATTAFLPSENGTWSSSNEAVASISNGGLVTALTPGNAVFTFTNTLTGCSSTTSDPVTVLAEPNIEIQGPSEICEGAVTSLQPSSGGTWVSSNSAIATVTLGGQVTGISEGAVTFTFIENSTGCESNNSISVDILSRPTAVYDGSSNLCIGGITNILPNSGGVWMSTNTSVATIANDGAISALAPGISRFIFVSDEGCASAPSQPLVVNNNPTIAYGGPTNLCIGAELNISPNTDVTWISNDATVASITDRGVITGVSPGTVTFYYIENSTGCVSNESDLFTVDNGPQVNIIGDDMLCVGEVSNVAPSVGGIWTSSNDTIATVDNMGGVTALAAGKVTFVYTDSQTGCQSEPTDSLTVFGPPTINYSGTTNLCVSGTTSLIPSSGGIWTSTNTAVATITPSGDVTAIGQGAVNFIFVDANTNCESVLSPALTVSSPPVTYFDGNDEICINGETFAMPNMNGVWLSSDPSVAAVTDLGVVTGIAGGTAMLTYTDTLNGCESSDPLNIIVKDTSVVSITGDSDICMGGVTTLSPSSGGIWTSSNTNIATVNSQGIVKGLAPGVVSFTYVDASSGCPLGSTTGPVSISKCINHDFNVTNTSLTISSSVATNDNGPLTTTYNFLQTLTKPAGSIPNISINGDGTYSFASTMAGNYEFEVEVCLPPFGISCTKSILEITVVGNVSTNSNPVANLETGIVYAHTDSSVASAPLALATLENDKCVKSSDCVIDDSSVSIIDGPSNGTAVVQPDGSIIYTANAGFIGKDTIHYTVCEIGDVTNCDNSMQVYTVGAANSENHLVASDDFTWTKREQVINGNVVVNDSDPENDLITVSVAGSEASPIAVTGGAYYILANGDYQFTPDETFAGYSEFSYTICDDNADQKCSDATVHILVLDDIGISIRTYLSGALVNSSETTGDGTPLMRDELRVSPFTGKNYIPLHNPYKISANPLLEYTDYFKSVGPDTLAENNIITDSVGVFSVTGRDAIVDWIYVELRSKTNYYDVIASRSGLLQRDGDVVDLDGTSKLRFQGVTADSFYVVVKHRSHLGAMSMLVPNDGLVDFTDPNTEIFDFGTTKVGRPDYTGLATSEYVLSGYRALWVGDFDCNGNIKFTNPNDDQNFLFFEVLLHPNNTEANINFDFAYGYYNGDADMNSRAKYTNPNDDLNFLFFSVLTYPLNTQVLSNFSFMDEQIPRD